MTEQPPHGVNGSCACCGEGTIGTADFCAKCEHHNCSTVDARCPA